MSLCAGLITQAYDHETILRHDGSGMNKSIAGSRPKQERVWHVVQVSINSLNISTSGFVNGLR